VRWLVALVIVASCARGGDAPGPGPRVVSLTPSATEVVAALGATAALVGVDDYSTYPPEVKALPKVGNFLQPNVEAIVRLHPTLVIVDDVHAVTAKALSDAGVVTAECPMHDVADVRSCLQAIGARLGKAHEAAQQIATIDAAIAAARAHPVKRVRVLAVIDRAAGSLGKATAAGPGSWIGDLLEMVGAANAIEDSHTRYPPISLETMLRAEPDVIFDLSGQDMAAWNDLDVPAVKTKRVFALTGEYLQSPRPRIAAALEAVANALK
jgi:iron complex transport system substrate-binding protein